MAPLESGCATFQSPSEQREKCSHRAHSDERKHESGLFRLQTSPQMKWKLPAIQFSVTRNPVAWGTVTEHLPCLSESLFVEVVMCASRLSSPGACNVSVCTAPLASRPKSSSTSRSAAASLFRMMTDVCPPGSFAAYAVALTPVACSFVESSAFNNVPPLNEPANLSPYATGSNT